MPNKYPDPHPWTLAQIKQIGGRLVGLWPQCWWPLDDHSGVIFAATPPECLIPALDSRGSHGTT